MDRRECEELILEKLKEIGEIYKQYNEDGNWLFLNVNIKDGEHCMHNEYWEDDIEKPINLWHKVIET